MGEISSRRAEFGKQIMATRMVEALRKGDEDELAALLRPRRTFRRPSGARLLAMTLRHDSRKPTLTGAWRTTDGSSKRQTFSTTLA